MGESLPSQPVVLGTSPHSIHDFRDSRVSARVASASVAIPEGLSRQYGEAGAVCALTRIQQTISAELEPQLTDPSKPRIVGN